MCSWNAGCPKNLVETSLWKAWVWVAWIDRGQQILDTEKLQWKVIRIHHWFTTQTWTLTISRWIATPDSIIHPYRQPWCLHEVNGFAIKNSANGFLKQACRTNLFAAVGHIWRTRAAERLKLNSSLLPGFGYMETWGRHRKMPWRCSSWIVTPHSIIQPYRQPWCLHEVNGFAIKNSGNGFLKQACRTNLFAAVAVVHI